MMGMRLLVLSFVALEKVSWALLRPATAATTRFRSVARRAAADDSAAATAAAAATVQVEDSAAAAAAAASATPVQVKDGRVSRADSASVVEVLQDTTPTSVSSAPRERAKTLRSEATLLFEAAVVGCFTGGVVGAFKQSITLVENWSYNEGIRQ